MGKLKGPLFGSTGSAWDMTLGTWNNIKIFKGKRKKGLTNASPEVLAHQSAMAQAVAVGQKILGLIRTTYQAYKGTSGTWGAYLKDALDNGFDYSVPGVATLQGSAYVVGKGQMTPTTPLTAAGDISANTLIMTWPTTVSDDTQASTDKFYAVVYNVDQQVWNSHLTSIARSTGTATFTLPLGTIVTDNVLTYSGFYSDLGDTAGTNSSSIEFDASLVP